MTESVAEAVGNQRRMLVLRPFLEQLELLGRGAGGVPPVLKLGSATLELEPWETSAMQAALANAGPQGDDWRTLLLEGVAFQSKFLTELDELEGAGAASPSVQASLRNRLVTDAAVGLALLDETQAVIDAMVQAGRVDRARKMSGFRARLTRGVHQIRGHIAAAAFSEAESLAVGMITPQWRQTAPSLSSDPLPAAPSPAAAPSRPEASAAATTAPVSPPVQPEKPEAEEHPDAPADGAEAARRRGGILAPFLMQLDLLQASREEELPAHLIPACRALALSGWEREGIQRGLSGSSGERRWPGFLVESVAFESMSIAGLEQLDLAGSEGERTRLVEQLIVASAVGLALAEELQRSVTEVIAGGDFETGKHLSGFRTKILKRVRTLETRIGADGTSVARERSQGLVTFVAGRPIAVSGSTNLPDSPRRETSAAATATVVAVADESTGHAGRWLLVLLVVLVLLAASAVVVLPRMTDERLPTPPSRAVPPSSAAGSSG
jgi:hypothetical protein